MVRSNTKCRYNKCKIAKNRAKAGPDVSICVVFNRYFRYDLSVKFCLRVDHSDNGLPMPASLLKKDRLFTNIVFVFSLAIIVGLYLWSLIGANWRWDDTQILLFLIQNTPFEYLSSPVVWQNFSSANLTPWLLLSFEIDFALFGFKPIYFYLHQILALLITAMLFYACLRLWVNRLSALYGLILFLAGAPSMSVTQQLMTRHYIEGAVFFLLSVFLFVKYLRFTKMWFLVVSSIAYVLAISAKEIYVPLIVLLLFIPESNISNRIRALAPFILITSLYIFWRGYMLSSYSGGYIDLSELATLNFVTDVAANFSHFPILLTGIAWPIAVFIYFLLMSFYFWRSRKSPLFTIIAVILVLTPLVPLVSSPGINNPDRYLFLFWIAISFSFTCYSSCLSDQFLGSKNFHRRNLVVCSKVVFLICTAIQGVITLLSVSKIGNEFDVQSKFVWSNNEEIAFVPSNTIIRSFWFFRGLRDLKKIYKNGEKSPIPVIDPIYLNNDIEVLYTYNLACKCMRNSSESLAERLQQHVNNLNGNAELELEYSYTKGIFAWTAGPYLTGQWVFLSDQLGGIAQAPRIGQRRVSVEEGSEFYLRYSSPEGWLTYSDPLVIEDSEQPVHWTRYIE